MLKKLLSFLLSFCILAPICSAAVLAADNVPSYFVNGSVSGSTLTLHVYIQNTKALSGRLALSYDTELLETTGTGFYDVVESVGSVSVTTERHADSVLVGNGRVMFAWYASNFRGVNAAESDKEIAAVTLKLKNGVTADSFNANTLGLYYVNETMVDGWDCSSEIICNVNGRMMAYRNTAVDDTYCPISFEYPNSDVVPVVSHNITVNVKNTDGVTLESTVLLGSEEKQTDAYGSADFKLQKGTYVYRARAPYYETKEGFYNVGDEDAVFNIILRSYGQIAKDTAEALEVGYAEGDSAESVTTDLVLVTECDYGTISWESTDRSVVSPSGGVVRGYDDMEVTLIATVTVEGASHTKEFPITVKSRYTEKEKSAMIVSQDKANLEIGFAPGDSADYVTVGLTLPEAGNAGSAISWESSNESVISYTGAVSRPDYDTTVTLTATIIRGTVYDTKTFNVLVKGVSRPVTPTRTIAPVKTETPVVTVTPVKTEAPVVTAEPVRTETPVVVVTEAPVIPVKTETPSATEMPVVTVTPTKTETPIVTEKPTPTEEPDDIEIEIPDVEPTPQVINETLDESNEVVQRILNALEIGYDKEDNSENVKSAITLPSIGSEGTPIVWTSSHPAVITPYGGVVRQVEDTIVTLTATITRGSVTEQKTFTVLVKAAEEIPENPNNGQEEEIKAKNSSRRSGKSTETKTTEGAAANGGNTSEAAENNTEKSDKENSVAKKFVDIDNVPWAQTAINTLVERGVINGTSDTTYSPHDNIRRADFVMLLVKLYDIDAQITETFEDVTADKYYYEAVSKAKSLGIIAGIDETHFNPDGHISRQDMMTMTYRALKQLDKTSDMPNSNLSAFRDADKVSDYALDSVRHLVGGGYIHGDTDGNLNPLANTTRAETAVFLYNLAS